MPGVAPLLQTFERHAQRRAAGLPTPVVLVGLDTVATWLDLHQERGVVRLSAADAARGASAYLDAPLVRARLATRIEARILAARASLPATVPRTAYEADVWSDLARDTLLGAGDAEAALLVSSILRAAREDAETRAFAAAMHVLGDLAPALLVDTGGGLDPAVRAAVGFAEASPCAHVAVVTDAGAWALWSERPGREHAKALLRACVAELPPDRRIADETRAIDDARALGARAKQSRAPEDDDAARSAAERALFEALESAPHSRGRFSLNHRLDILFGNRELEIDLACTALRLAVEVDGYFHFQDPGAYRRDRRKDVVLQREGYFVVRVLAEDITDRIDEIVETIPRVMTHIESRSGEAR